MFEARIADTEALAERMPEGMRPYLPPRAPLHGPLRVGLLNNMPDAALIQTERQFRRLIEAGAEGRAVELVLFSLDGLPRGEQARAHLDAAYASHRTLASAGLDALIVTGCEPRAGRLCDEPYFSDFAGVVDWAGRSTASTLFSCLAAHAAVLHLDGVERCPLPAKHSGIYPCDVVSDHALIAGGPLSVPVPHSRWNDLAETDLAAAGYTILRRSEDVGVDLFAREVEKSLFLFLQGHPEYDGDSLAREYRRDVGRYLAAERDDCPALPANYFPTDAARRLAAFADAAGQDRSPERFRRFPAIDARPPLQSAWQAGAAALFRNWLALVAERREVSAAARAAAEHPMLHVSPDSLGKPSSTFGWIGALQRTGRIDAQPSRTFPVVVDELAAEHGEAPALIGEDESFSHAGLAARQNRVARWALAEGIAKGETVALLMRNRPEFVALWLGLTRVGVRVALLNTNLRGRGLAHCIDVAKAAHIIVETGLSDVFEDTRGHLTTAPKLWAHGAGADGLETALAGFDGAPLSAEEERAVVLADEALLIYTSGTTGLPKAARVSHHRIMMWTHWFAGLIDPKPTDRMYDCLPLYHSVGGVVAVGSVLVGGGSVVIREKFSASRFWDDVVSNGCTLFQYIGELCRYLASAPSHPLERSHSLRLCAGNGLRPDVWERFAERFAMPRILEFYAATEGTVSLYNVEGKVGAVGRIPSFMAHRSPALLVRHDVETGLPYRGADGLCVPAAKGEPGELLGRLSAKAEHRFEGYTSAHESLAKVLTDVLKPGDAWMRTGDLMRQDAQGFFHFVDRIGDTFRWKGENVATTEVAEALSGCPGVLDVAVYGVAVPGTDGRAGMAAITAGPGFDLAALRAQAQARLPAYARPVFLRVCAEIGLTETFKQKKAVLAAEGFDPSRIADALYVDDAAAGTYRPLDSGVFDGIASGAVRL